MTVVLVTQEVGSGGREVASGIARALGLQFVPQEHIVRLVATRMRVEVDRLRRVVSGNASAFDRLAVDRRRLAICAAEEITKLASQDELVMEVWRTLERLGPDQHVMCVHVCTATSRRSIKWKNIARSLMPRPISDNSPEGSGVQDIILNTSLSSVPECVERATRLARASRRSRTSASIGMLDSLLHQTHAHPRGISGTADDGKPRVLDVEVGRHRMRLFGVRSNEQAIADIEQRLSGKVGCAHVRRYRYPLPLDLI